MEQLESITAELHHTAERARAGDAQRLSVQRDNDQMGVLVAGMGSENTALRAALLQR